MISSSVSLVSATRTLDQVHSFISLLHHGFAPCDRVIIMRNLKKHVRKLIHLIISTFPVYLETFHPRKHRIHRHLFSNLIKGVFLVQMKNAFAPIERIYSVKTYLCISLFHEGVSEVSEWARERSEQAKQA